MRLHIVILAAILVAASPSVWGTDEEYLRSLVGKYPWEGAAQGDLSFFEVPSIEAALRQMLPSEVLKTITEELTTGTPNRIVSGYLLVSACKPHACPSKNYVAITNLRNASVAVVLYDSSAGSSELVRTRCFANTKDLRMIPDAMVEEILEMHVDRRKAGERLYSSNRWIDDVKCSDLSNTLLEREREK